MSQSRSRGWVFTLNNYDDVALASIRIIGEHNQVKYLVFGLEVGQAGTPHVQGFVYFHNAKTFNAVKTMFGNMHPHIEKMRGSVDEATAYCKKDNNFEEFGQRPLNQREKGDSEIERWDEARKRAKLGEWDEIPSDIFIRCLPQLQRIHQIEMESQVLPDLPILENHWYYGPSGAGKSSEARRLYPNAYLKAKNKWWGGYKFQEDVIIDDVDPTHEQWISAFLKEWADHYRFNAEIKGSAMVIRPKRIIVTSQYSIEQCFKDQETVMALKRRFRQTHFNLPLGH